MHSRTILSAAAFSSVAFAQIDQPIPSADAEGIASLINEAIPTEYQGLIPSQTQVVDALAAYVTSITAQPEFTAALAAVQSAVPLSAVVELGSDPQALIMELATGGLPDWSTALPADVVSYVESIGEQALSLVEGGTGTAGLGGLASEVEASATAAYGAYVTGWHSSPTGGYTYPTEGYAYPTGRYSPTAGTAVSSGFPLPTGNSSGVPSLPTANPETFTGAAAPPKSVALGAAAMVAGVAALFVL